MGFMLAPGDAARKTTPMFDPFSHFLPDEAATSDLGRFLATLLQAGDVLLLSGGIGAGKTHLSRALIRACLSHDEDIPSPSFTLVQTYATTPEIWHADLYRLSHPDEVLELGLDTAFETAICLVEWPDRLGNLAPQDALHLTLTPEAEGRRITLSGGRPGLLPQIARSLTP